VRLAGWSITVWKERGDLVLTGSVAHCGVKWCTDDSNVEISLGLCETRDVFQMCKSRDARKWPLELYSVSHCTTEYFPRLHRTPISDQVSQAVLYFEHLQPAYQKGGEKSAKHPIHE
jgi:hypothetical protein